MEQTELAQTVDATGLLTNLLSTLSGKMHQRAYIRIRPAEASTGNSQ